MAVKWWPSPRFGIVADGVDLGADASWAKPPRARSTNRMRCSADHSQAVNQCRETTVGVHNAAGENYELDVRAYNDGVALRARLAAKPGRKINGETHGMEVARQSAGMVSDGFRQLRGAIPEHPAGGFVRRAKKFRCRLPSRCRAAAMRWSTEANLLNYSDLGVQVAADHSLRAYFHASQSGWTSDDAVIQPWRVTLLARDLNALVNSDSIRNLCPPAPPELAKADWIQPGRSSWQWWSSGGPIYSEQHQWVDWTKQLGFEYYLVDEGWKGWNANGQDNWACLREVCDYAKTQGVKIWAWVNSNDVATPATRTNFLDRAVAAGVVGVKIDFEPQANVRWANWYDESLRDAAARKLMLDFHGANKPVGRERTWPNEITRESIRGHEYHILRYHRTLPPQHDCILPFTRFVIGPGDYTPTVFNPKELRGYTWARELSQAIVFTSPFLCYADHPTELSE